jgi:ubiquinone/menaquinone biosynthesis C-methylase UbiE
MASPFDFAAASFERYRALPEGVPGAIRKTIWDLTGPRSSRRILDLGAGSGRFGRVFVEAHDSYTGADLSFSMLREFRAQSASAALVQADGGCLPFRDESFDLVLLMQVLSGAHNWRNLLVETVRVIVPGGFVVVGHTVAPPEGIDALMKRQLSRVLEEMGAAPPEPKKSRQQALEWFYAGATGRSHTTASSWTTDRTARQFLDRHRSGARFSTLPSATQETALKKMAAWAIQKFGSLDKVFSEQHSFELDVFRIGAG